MPKVSRTVILRQLIYATNDETEEPFFTNCEPEARPEIRAARELVLTRDEIRRLLNVPSRNFRARDNGLRDRALLHFYYSGPKRGELPDVRVDDVDVSKPEVKVNGRIVPLKPQAAEAQ